MYVCVSDCGHYEDVDGETYGDSGYGGDVPQGNGLINELSTYHLTL